MSEQELKNMNPEAEQTEEQSASQPEEVHTDAEIEASAEAEAAEAVEQEEPNASMEEPSEGTADQAESETVAENTPQLEDLEAAAPEHAEGTSEGNAASEETEQETPLSETETAEEAETVAENTPELNDLEAAAPEQEKSEAEDQPAESADTEEAAPAEAEQAADPKPIQTVLPLDTGRGEAILEGLLFIVGDDGLTAEQAAAALGIEPERVTAFFDDLQKKYTDEQYGIEIANYGGIYRFLSKAFVHEYARNLFQMGKEATLSQAALETLAIIAYKQPITRVEIEEIRGVGADMMLRKLLARDLIKESGRSDAPGRPILYEVTPEFMDSFKLYSLDELPELPKFGEDEDQESEDLFKQ